MKSLPPSRLIPLTVLLLGLAGLLCLATACDGTPADTTAADTTAADTPAVMDPVSPDTEDMTDAPTEEATEAPTAPPTEAPTEPETEPVPDVPAGGFVVTDTDGRNGVDFVIDYPAGKDLTILQLSDMQMQSLAGARNETRYNYFKDNYFTNKPEDLEIRNWRYVDEAVERVKPDLIILAGDMIYGELDDSGAMWSAMVQRMDSYGIPWCVIFGNHDNESAKGVRWQIQQLMDSRYCVFRRGDVSGNSNYNIVLRQGGEVKYLLYMMDSNGCGHLPAMPEAYLQKDNVDYDLIVQTPGFKTDQVQWMADSIKSARKLYGDMPFLVFCHILPSEATSGILELYGNKATTLPFYPDREGDLGISHETQYLGANCGLFWRKAKTLDCKGIFSGHQHMIATSIMYQGIRVTFGLKTGTCDYHAHTMVGSTKITLGEADGALGVEYVYSELEYLG